jgi:ABC-type spermidine/putrescine transport system permease subunit I
MGYVNLILFDEVVGRVELLAGESVEASRILVMLEQAKAAVNSFWFKFAVIFISLLLALYIALMIARNKKRRKKPGFKRRRRI